MTGDRPGCTQPGVGPELPAEFGEARRQLSDVVDNGGTGATDQLGLLIRDPNNAPVAELTFQPLVLTGGNVQVPR